MATNNPTLQNAGSLEGTTIRKGGQIYQQPVTPAGQSSIGGTPDQAKMAGTPAQKKPVVEKAIARPTQQVSVAPRQLEASKVAEETAQQETAKRLSNLGGFNARVGALVQRKFSEVEGETATGRVAENDILNEAFDSDQLIGDSSVRNLLDKFLSDPTDQTPLVALSESLRADGNYVSPEQISSWIGTGSRALGESAGRFIADKVIMSDFVQEDFQELGFENSAQVASALGIDPTDFQTLTFSEFQDAIEDQRQEMFTEVEQLRQELGMAQPGSAHARQIEQRIADLTGTGTTVTEERMTELVNNLNEADQIQVGDTTVSVEDILKDDNITSMVMEWLAEPDQERKDAIIPPEWGEFTDWIISQQEVLSILADDLQGTTESFGEAQLGLRAIQDAASNSPALSKALESAGINISGFMTESDLNALKAEADKVPVFKLFMDDPETLGISSEEQLAMQSAMTDEAYEALKNKPIESIISGWQLGQELLGDQDLADFSGVTGNRFITSEGEVRNVNNAKKILLAIDRYSPLSREQLKTDAPKVLNMIRDGDMSPELLQYFGNQDASGRSVLANPVILGLVEDGKITPQNAENVLTNAGKSLQLLERDLNLVDSLQSKDPDDFLNYMFDDANVDTGALQNNFDRSRELERMGAPGAAENVSQFGLIDFNGDGRLDQGDITGMKGEIPALPSEESYIMDGASIDYDVPLRGDLDTQQALQNPLTTSALFDEAFDMMEGGIDEAEAERLYRSYNIDELSEEWRMENLPEGWQSREQGDQRTGTVREDQTPETEEERLARLRRESEARTEAERLDRLREQRNNPRIGQVDLTDYSELSSMLSDDPLDTEDPDIAALMSHANS